MELQSSEATQPFAVTGEVLSGSQTTQANLTIIDFTSSLEMSVLKCFIIINYIRKLHSSNNRYNNII